ncbi:MAG: isoprenylcysteine carboxylmethyltransferase family protein [Chloroflexi bacterium]|nr:isoprenylcysteine carboxylmethyltransferase family protein [Chloroflexota bacterium]
MEIAARSGENYKHTLVTAGPYAYVRNPMYLAAMLLGLLYVVISGVWYSLFIWILGYVFTYSQVIKYEEEDLHLKFGRKYEEYRSKVPRLIPALRAYDDGIGEFKLGSETLRNALAEMIILSAFWFLYWWL